MTVASTVKASVIDSRDVETLLQAWGAFCRGEVDAEVGFPGYSPSCQDYESPDWTPPPPSVVSQEDLNRALWAMMLILARGHKRIHRDATEHYCQKVSHSWERVAAIKAMFSSTWAEWDALDGEKREKH